AVGISLHVGHVIGGVEPVRHTGLVGIGDDLSLGEHGGYRVVTGDIFKRVAADCADALSVDQHIFDMPAAVGADSEALVIAADDCGLAVGAYDSALFGFGCDGVSGRAASATAAAGAARRDDS